MNGTIITSGGSLLPARQGMTADERWGVTRLRILIYVAASVERNSDCIPPFSEVGILPDAGIIAAIGFRAVPLGALATLFRD